MPAVRKWTDPEGVPVTILTRRSKGRWRDMSFAIQVAWTIWRRRKEFDVIYFLMAGLHVAAGILVARALRKPMVVKIAGSGVIPLMRRSRAGCFELDRIREWKVPLMLLNQGMMDEAIADGLSQAQLVWMPNPLDIEQFRPARPGEAEDWRQKHGIPVEAFVVVYVGRLSVEKGLPGLLKGFALAMKQAPDMLLLLVGDGPMRPEVEALARSLDPSLERIRLTGRAPIDEVPFWFRAADVFALTSPSEGFPCSLLEAMGAGLPSVVSAIPANLQLVDDGVHGLTAEWNDENAIGQAFLKLRNDPEGRRRMGAEARKRVVENYSTDKVLDRYETVFSASRTSGGTELSRVS